MEAIKRIKYITAAQSKIVSIKKIQRALLNGIMLARQAGNCLKDSMKMNKS